MPEITITPELKNRSSLLRLGCIEADVFVSDSAKELLFEIDKCSKQIADSKLIEDISKIPLDSIPERYKL